MRKRAGLIAGVVLLLVAVIGVAGQRWWQHRPPYGSEALRAAATLSMVDQATADAALRPGHGEIAATSPRPGEVGTGGDASLDMAQDRYPWLRAAGTREADGSLWSAGSAISVSSLDAAPVTFTFVLRQPRAQTPLRHEIATAPAATGDLLVALLHVGRDGHLHWAQRLLN